jgi:hypothetical protein
VRKTEGKIGKKRERKERMCSWISTPTNKKKRKIQRETRHRMMRRKIIDIEKKKNPEFTNK